jgi:hypothetical protein
MVTDVAVKKQITARIFVTGYFEAIRRQATIDLPARMNYRVTA